MFKLLCFLLAAFMPIYAQSNFATLSGRVQDPAQTSIFGAASQYRQGNSSRPADCDENTMACSMCPIWCRASIRCK